MRAVLKKIANRFGLLPAIWAFRRIKNRASTKLFSALGLSPLLNTLRMRAEVRQITHKNKQFIRAYPDFVLPPQELAFDAYAHVDWNRYVLDGQDDAALIAKLALKYTSALQLRILDWGCGPARVLRNLPKFLDSRSISLYGSDYNPKTIQWCQKHFKECHFAQNHLSPPLAFESNFFDVIYAISVLTHLSEESHFNWINEIKRVLKPKGIFILTTHGDYFKSFLSKSERSRYQKNQLVVRNDEREGKRDFATFHPPQFLKDTLFIGFDVEEHIPGPVPISSHLTQDLWVIRKK